MFSDLRSFIDQLRRDRDLVEISAPVDPVLEAAEIHRRVIAAGGPALLFTNVKGADFPLVTNLFGTAAPRRARVRHAPARLHQARGAPGRDDVAADAGQAVGRARCRPRPAEGRHPEARGRSGSRGRDVGRAPRSPAGHHLLARRWRTVRHVPAGLHAASREARTQPRHVSHAGARPRLDRHALADRQGRRLSLRACGGTQRSRCR